jgi:hypothetical protein
MTSSSYFATEVEAMELAERLARQYAGTAARFWVEPVRSWRPPVRSWRPKCDAIIGYGVRSNLVNGLPPAGKELIHG